MLHLCIISLLSSYVANYFDVYVVRLSEVPVQGASLGAFAPMAAEA